MRYCLLRDVSKASFTKKLRPWTLLPITRIGSREYLLDSLQSLLSQSTSMLLTRILITKITRCSSLATSAFRCLTLARRGMKGLQQPEKGENMWHRLLQLQWYSFRRHIVAKFLHRLLQVVLVHKNLTLVWCTQDEQAVILIFQMSHCRWEYQRYQC